jgi:tetratricopeptide (TPR) repeat protein
VEAAMRASISTMTLLGLAATLAAASLYSPPAHGQHRRSSFDASGLTMILGSSHARLCYEHALGRNSSQAALDACDMALNGALTHRNEVATLVNRSIVLAQRGDLQAALGDLDAASALEPDMPAVHMNYGDVYTKLERWTEADAAFSRAIELGFAPPQRAHYARAIAREEAGDLAGAYQDYSTASRLAPDWRLPRRELERFVVGSDSAG